MSAKFDKTSFSLASLKLVNISKNRGFFLYSGRIVHETTRRSIDALFIIGEVLMKNEDIYRVRMLSSEHESNLLEIKNEIVRYMRGFDRSPEIIFLSYE